MGRCHPTKSSGQSSFECRPGRVDCSVAGQQIEAPGSGDFEPLGHSQPPTERGLTRSPKSAYCSFCIRICAPFFWSAYPKRFQEAEFRSEGNPNSEETFGPSTDRSEIEALVRSVRTRSIHQAMKLTLVPSNALRRPLLFERRLRQLV